MATGLSAGTAYMRIVPNFTGFESALTKNATTALGRVGASISRTGTALTKGLTVPLVAIGAISTKMATDYESAFTRIGAVSNASAQDVARWKEEVKGLATATARDPKELADALFFLASAGLKTSQIMPTLRASAKAAAAGLGDTADIAKLTANALNAYSGTGLRSAQVTDILVAAVREGSADTDEFATAMGRILPIASKAGVGFDEIAASLASLSNIGLDVNEGTTAMRGVLQALEAPGTQAAKTLREVGISVSEMRHALADEGLLGALRLLEDRTNGNIGTMRKIIPNVRALTGVFGLTTQQANRVNHVFDAVANSTGSLDKAFAETQKGPAFQFQQALTELKVAAIDLGEKLIPVATKVAGAIGDLAGAFGRLSPGQQEAIVKAGALVAALGPVLRITGSLLGAMGKAAGATKTFFTVLSGGEATMGATITSAGALAAAGLAIGVAAARASHRWQTFVTELHPELIDAAADLVGKKLRDSYFETTRANRIFGQGLVSTSRLTQKQKQNIGALLSGLDKYDVKLSAGKVTALKSAIAFGRYNDALRILKGLLRGATAGLSNLQGPASQARENMADLGQRTAYANSRLREQGRLVNPHSNLLKGLANLGSYAQIAAEHQADLGQKTAYANAQLIAQSHIPTGGGGGGGGRHDGGGGTTPGGQLAAGFHGWVTHPTSFVAGEAGPERLDVTPISQTRSSRGTKAKLEGTLRFDWRRGMASLEGIQDWREQTRPD